MSFAHLYAGRKEPTRPIFGDGCPLPSEKLLFIKPTTSNKKSNNLQKLSLESLQKQIQITKSNLKLPSLDAKGKEKLENLLHKYEAEIGRRLSSMVCVEKCEIKQEPTFKEESIKDEPVEEAVKVTLIDAKQPIFHVSDDLLTKMQSLSIDPHKDKLNVAKKGSSAKSTSPSSSSSASSSARNLNDSTQSTEKSIKFLSLEESTELVKQRKFIPKSIPRATIPDFSSEEDEEPEDDDDDEAFERANISDDDS